VQASIPHLSLHLQGHLSRRVPGFHIRRYQRVPRKAHQQRLMRPGSGLYPRRLVWATRRSLHLLTQSMEAARMGSIWLLRLRRRSCRKKMINSRVKCYLNIWNNDNFWTGNTALLWMASTTLVRVQHLLAHNGIDFQLISNTHVHRLCSMSDLLKSKRIYLFSPNANAFQPAFMIGTATITCSK